MSISPVKKNKDNTPNITSKNVDDEQNPFAPLTSRHVHNQQDEEEDNTLVPFQIDPTEMSFQIEVEFTHNIFEETKQYPPMTGDSELPSMDYEGLFKMKEEFIFVFSGFNDKFMESVEVLDVTRGIWRKFEGVCSHRTKF